MDQTLDSVELVTRPTSSTQFYLFNLFADYIVPRGGCIWTSDLLYLMDLLDVSERAVRSTLSRMKQRGWFLTYRKGRESQYVITAAGRAILEEGDKRIFEAPLTDWDGQWHLVVYSLPEELRKERNELRKKLNWLSFGQLAPGTWISPHNRENEIVTISNHLDVRDCVTLFHGRTIRADEEIVRQCWDILDLEAGYREFLQRYRPEYEALKSELNSNGWDAASPEEYFQRRFWLTFDFQSFPRQDPNLPQRLLPQDWIGYEARQLFLDYRALLSTAMGDFLDHLIGACE